MEERLTFIRDETMDKIYLCLTILDLASVYMGFRLVTRWSELEMEVASCVVCTLKEPKSWVGTMG